jgi:hypothetical protein
MVIHRLSLGLIALYLWGTVLAGEEVYFADANLKAAVEAKLGISDPTPADMLILRSLDAHGKDIETLEGLEFAMNLRTLLLYDNQVSDISPLSGLTKLSHLYAENNGISDISALVNLMDLQILELHKNPLNQAAYCSHLQTLMTQNPNMTLSYSPNTGTLKSIWSSNGLYPDKIDISWSELCNGPDFTSYYRVFRATSADSSKVPVSPWQSAIGFTDLAVDMGSQYHYWVQASTDMQGHDGVGFTGPAMGWLRHKYSLSLTSTAGGSVVTPGAGTHLYPTEGSVAVDALPIDARLYAFSAWTGTAVDAGRIDDPSQSSTVVVVDDIYT